MRGFWAITVLGIVAVWAGELTRSQSTAPGQGAGREKIAQEDYRIHPAMREGKWGYMDDSGKWAIEAQFEEALYFSEGLAGVKSHGLYGFIDPTGKWVIAPRFTWACWYKEGLVWAYGPNDSAGFFDRGGKQVFARDGTAKIMSEGLIAFGIGNSRQDPPAAEKYGFLNATGKVVIEARFDAGPNFYFREGVASMKAGEKWGFIGKDGLWVIPPTFDMAYDFNEGYAPVRVGDEWFYIGRNGAKLFGGRGFEEANGFHEGLSGVKSNGKWGFIDHDGKMAIEAKFDEVSSFFSGMAAFEENKKWGYMNVKGEIVIKPQLDEAQFFLGELALVSRDGRDGLIDKRGNIVCSWEEKKSQQ